MGGTAWLVIAGGLGTRYGEPKYAAEFGSSTFLDRCLDVIGSVAQTGDSTLVVLRDGQSWCAPPGIRLIRDDVDTSGPIAGLLAGIGAIGNEGIPPDALVTLPVDMPYLTSEVLLGLHEACIRDNSIAVAQSRKSGDMHWPLAGYSDAVLPDVAARIRAGDRSLNAVISAVGFSCVSVADDIARNINYKPS